MKLSQIIKYDELIDSLSINETEKPSIKATDILIETKAAGLSPSDYKMNILFLQAFFRNTKHSEMLCFQNLRLLFWLALSLVWLPSNGFAQIERSSINIKIHIVTILGLSPVRFFESRKVSLVNFKIRIQDYDNTNNRKRCKF
jgi:hypothetical protein